MSDYLLIGAVAARRHVRDHTRSSAASLAHGWRGWVVEPNERSVHTTPIPHVGGIAMLGGFLVAMLMAWSLGRFDVGLRRQLRTDRHRARGADRLRGGLPRRHPRHGAARPRSPASCSPGSSSSWFGVTMIYFRVPVLRRDRPVERLDAARHRVLAARHDTGHQPDRRARRARGRHRRHRVRSRSSSTRSDWTNSTCCPTATWVR